MRARCALHILWIGLIAIACSGTPETRDRGPLHQACAGDDLDACHEYAQQNENGGTREHRRALIAYQYACFLDHQPSCAALARLYGKEPTASDARLVGALESACTAQEWDACVQLAGRSNRMRARELYEKACEADYGPGCYHLAEITRRGWMVQANMVEALELHARACRLGAPRGCVGAGKAYLFGSGVPRDAERGLELLEPTCTEETVVGCPVLAKIWEEGIGVQPDLAKASEYYERAEAAASEEAADSPATAYIAFVHACSQGDLLGCFNAGWFRAEGVEVARNITISREFFQLACRGGLTTACGRWETIEPDSRAALLKRSAEGMQ